MLSVETHRGHREAIREGSYGRFLYNFYRTYDPDTGRYLEADPIGEQDGPNLYVYADSNLIVYVDPSGLLSTCDRYPQYCTGVPVEIPARPPPVPLPPVAPPVFLVPDEGAGVAPLPNTIPGARSPEAQCKCRPCVPPVGTVAYRRDVPKRTGGHHPVVGPHYQYYEMNQSPHPVCKCFWRPLKRAVTPGSQPPLPGAVPITPAAGGGPG